MTDSKLIEGNREFVKDISTELDAKMTILTVKGQSPKTLFIGCCDSRVAPNIITNTHIGDLFISRTIGNFVSPYDPDASYPASASAVEYAVSALNVETIVVCGHTHCGAIAGLFGLDTLDDREFSNTKKWLSLGTKAKDEVLKLITKDTSEREKLEMTEKLSAVYQLDNLLTYPAVKKRVEEGTLTLNAWHYNIDTGIVSRYDSKTKEFVI